MSRIDSLSIWLTVVGIVVTAASGTTHAQTSFTSRSAAVASPRPAIAQTAAASAEAQGKNVRVTTMDGDRRTGKLVSLSDSQVVLMVDRQRVPTPLGEVRRVEKVSHHKLIGGLLGAGAGFAIAYSAGHQTGYCIETCLMTGIVYGVPIGIGVGVGIGAIINAAKADENLIYQTPGPPGLVSVAPILSPRRQGVALKCAGDEPFADNLME